MVALREARWDFQTALTSLTTISASNLLVPLEDYESPPTLVHSLSSDSKTKIELYEALYGRAQTERATALLHSISVLYREGKVTAEVRQRLKGSLVEGRDLAGVESLLRSSVTLCLITYALNSNSSKIITITITMQFKN
jgi:hypothetical protein